MKVIEVTTKYRSYIYQAETRKQACKLHHDLHPNHRIYTTRIICNLKPQPQIPNLFT
jgi:hypothetical protein